jgi:hypothetical protein
MLVLRGPGGCPGRVVLVGAGGRGLPFGGVS